MGFVFIRKRDLNNSMQLSSGQLLADGLDGGNTIILIPYGMRMQTNPSFSEGVHFPNYKENNYYGHIHYGRFPHR